MIKSFARLFTVIAVLAIFATVSNAQDIHRTFDISSGGKLVLDLETGGSVFISGWSREQIEVSVTIKGRDKDMVVVEFEKSKRALEIYSEFSQRRARADVDMEIKVPANFDLEISTVGGDVTIDGIEGKIQGSSMGGDLEFSHLNGTIDFTTMGGNIKLRDSRVDGSLHSMGGDVEISDVVGNMSGTTMGGDVTYDNVRSGESGSQSEITISTMGGDIQVGEALYGADLHTMGGDIEIEKAGIYVKATTMGGDITVEEIDGWIEASTMGGDIEATMVGGTVGDRHIDLESMGGTIEITVPSGLSMDIKVVIKLSRDADDDEYRIISDFDLDISIERSESNRRWKSGGEIVGTASVNGGRNKVTIRTRNGDVILKKGR